MEQTLLNAALLDELKKGPSIDLHGNIDSELSKYPEFKDFFENLAKEMLEGIKAIAEDYAKDAKLSDLMDDDFNLNRNYAHSVLKNFSKTFGSNLATVFLLNCLKHNIKTENIVPVSDIIVFSSILEKLVGSKTEPMLLACISDCKQFPKEKRLPFLMHLLKTTRSL